MLHATWVKVPWWIAVGVAWFLKQFSPIVLIVWTDWHLVFTTNRIHINMARDKAVSKKQKKNMALPVKLTISFTCVRICCHAYPLNLLATTCCWQQRVVGNNVEVSNARSILLFFLCDNWVNIFSFQEVTMLGSKTPLQSVQLCPLKNQVFSMDTSMDTQTLLSTAIQSAPLWLSKMHL